MSLRKNLCLSVSAVALSAVLAGCGSVGAGVGVGIPIGPFSLGVGLGSGGLSAGVGTSKVLHDPNQPQNPPASPAPSTYPVQAAEPSAQDGAVQWRDSRGQPVPACRAEGRC